MCYKSMHLNQTLLLIGASHKEESKNVDRANIRMAELGLLKPREQNSLPVV